MFIFILKENFFRGYCPLLLIQSYGWKGLFDLELGFPETEQERNASAMQKTKEMRVQSLGQIPRWRAWQPNLVFLLGNPVDKGTWRAIAHGVIKRRT